jgi:hypothetical protein
MDECKKLFDSLVYVFAHHKLKFYLGRSSIFYQCAFAYYVHRGEIFEWYHLGMSSFFNDLCGWGLGY